MKKRLVLLFSIPALLLIFVPLILSAIEKMHIIDFGTYEPRIFSEFPNVTDTRETFRHPDGRPQLTLTTNDLALNNWRVRLLSSGKRNTHIVHSFCRKVYSNEQESTVLGVRVRFPETRQNDRAVIEPLFSFNAYDTNGRFSNLTNGVVANVGIIRDVSITVKGRNYPYKLALRMFNENHETKEFFFGTLFFDNWRTLTWVNPNYIPAIKDRVLVRQPLYPRDIPYLRFQSLVVYRDMEEIGGDFVVYFKDIEIVYEKYSEYMYDGDIDDEEEWQILQKKALERMHIEHDRLADVLDVYRTETRRLGEEEEDN